MDNPPFEEDIRGVRSHRRKNQLDIPLLGSDYMR